MLIYCGRAGDRARRIRVFNAKAKSSSQANISDDCQALQAVSRQLRLQLHNLLGLRKGRKFGAVLPEIPYKFSLSSPRHGAIDI